MDKPRTKSGSSCLKFLTIGCVALFALAVIGGLATWLSWGAIQETEWYRFIAEKAEATQEELENMLAMRASLIEEFPAQEVQVNTLARIGGAGPRKSLVVNFLNPAFPDLDSSPSEADAREVALAVASRYPEIESFSVVRIAFTSQVGVGVTLKSTSGHSFHVAELLEQLEQRPETLPPPEEEPVDDAPEECR